MARCPAPRQQRARVDPLCTCSSGCWKLGQRSYHQVLQHMRPCHRLDSTNGVWRMWTGSSLSCSHGWKLDGFGFFDNVFTLFWRSVYEASGCTIIITTCQCEGQDKEGSTARSQSCTMWDNCLKGCQEDRWPSGPWAPELCSHLQLNYSAQTLTVCLNSVQWFSATFLYYKYVH